MLAKNIELIVNEINSSSQTVMLSGLTSVSAKAYVLSHIKKAIDRPFVIVTDSKTGLDQWTMDFEFWDKDISVVSLPAFETGIYSGVSPHAETQERRALALWQMSQKMPDVLIVAAKALITRTLLPSETLELGAKLVRDEDFPLDELIAKLAMAGYVRAEPIANIGEYSVRGGIIDIWPPLSENPARIEFFGDTIESIRSFDAGTQLSTGQLTEITIAPMREFAAAVQDFKDWAYLAKETFEDDKFARNLKDRTDFAAAGEAFSGWEFLFPLVKPLDGCLFDYLRDAILVADEPTLLEQHFITIYETVAASYAAIMQAGDIGLEPDALFLSPQQLQKHLGELKRIELRALGKIAGQTDEEFQIN